MLLKRNNIKKNHLKNKLSLYKDIINRKDNNSLANINSKLNSKNLMKEKTVIFIQFYF